MEELESWRTESWRCRQYLITNDTAMPRSRQQQQQQREIVFPCANWKQHKEKLCKRKPGRSTTSHHFVCWFSLVPPGPPIPSCCEHFGCVIGEKKVCFRIQTGDKHIMKDEQAKFSDVCLICYVNNIKLSFNFRLYIAPLHDDDDDVSRLSLRDQRLISSH